ncbi:MAG: PrsW family intramembrane metalloprotease, partial [Actinobacteria bacterium]|nr:PrsW family intramembrane metalloprotease [Actinomycetota bacterium]
MLFLRLLDPYEREPLSAIGLTAVWGATGAAAIALIGNQAVQGMLSARTRVALGAAISAPLVEESAKCLALVAVAAVSWWTSTRFGTPSFEGVTDGIVYGAAVGFGFAFTEDFFYLLDQARQSGLDTGIRVFVERRDFFGPQGLHHPLFTAAFGAALGLATWSRTRLWRIGLPLLGLGAAILLHAVNNGLAEAVLTLRYGVDIAAAWSQGAPVPAPVASTGSSLLAVLAAVDYVYLAAAALAVLAWQRHQRRVIFSELSQEVASGLISSADRRTVSRFWRRTSSYWYLLRRRDFAGWLRLRRYHHAVVQLALVKWRTRRFSGDMAQIRQSRRRLASIQATTSPPGNLDIPRTSLVGRERELSELAELFQRREARFVNLTGAGGTGRTRLALEVAAYFSEVFAGGAFFLPAGGDTDVAGLIARTLGIKELPEHPLVPRLAGYLTDKALLLVLDDLDQAEGAAEAISALLLAAPHLQVLATSSGPLGLPAERDYPLSTLA